jgi:hypothetical protein
MILYFTNCEWQTNFKCFNCFIEANKRISDNFKLINLTQDNVKPLVPLRFTVQSYLTRDLKKERFKERAQQTNKENKNKNNFFFLSRFNRRTAVCVADDRVESFRRFRQNEIRLFSLKTFFNHFLEIFRCSEDEEKKFYLETSKVNLNDFVFAFFYS